MDKWNAVSISVYIVSSRLFKCSVAYAKKSFYRGANAIFGKIGLLASEEVVLQLKKQECADIIVWARSFWSIRYWPQITGFCNGQIFYEIIQNNKHEI